MPPNISFRGMGLAKTLEARKEIHIAATTGDCETIISLCSHHLPDIIMISAAMPGINNAKPYQHIAAEFPGTGIIMADDSDAETPKSSSLPKIPQNH